MRWVAHGELAALAAMALGCHEPRPPPRVPPAILLLTLDTTRADHLGSYGYGRPTSPGFDALAARGVLVEQATSPMPTTEPAHISLFTGLYPRTHGTRMNGVPLAQSFDTLAAWARRRGFRTGAFVSRKHILPSDLHLAGFEVENGPAANQRDGAETLAEASHWLDAHAAEPYLLWVHFFEPHTPYAPPQAVLARFGRQARIRIPKIRNGEARRYSEPQVALLTTRYDAEIAYMDQLIEQLLALVAATRPQSDAPLVVIAGDHGEALGELNHRQRFAFAHGAFLYQGLLHVPMLLIWPGRLPAGGRVRGAVSLVDVPATLFDLMGETGFESQGQSFANRIDREDGGPHYAFAERRAYKHPVTPLVLRGDAQYAVQDARYQLILSLPDEYVELYDLRDDPGETRNRAADLPLVRARLRDALDAWLARTRASESPLEVPEDRVKALEALGYSE
jgi:arylsulfatase A-like enzyme